MIKPFFGGLIFVNPGTGSAARCKVALQVGQTIHHDRYLIEAQLGQGGMGAVYLAWDQTLEVKVAIKENLVTSREAQKQFMNEAQILARLSHPNMPRVTDYFSLPEQGQYLVMDYVEGEDLQSMLRRSGRLPQDQALRWIRQIGDALAYLHGQPSPVVHRDIKPGNIKIRPDGRAMLVDFGIAKVYDPLRGTATGARAFTPGYSPPEQYGEGTTDPRSDIYALGATVYDLLTGVSPPDGVKRMLKQTWLIPPGQLNPEIDLSVERALLRAMEVEPEARFQTVGEFMAALVSLPAGEARAAATIAEKRVPPARVDPYVAVSPASSESPTAPLEILEDQARRDTLHRATRRPDRWILPVSLAALVVVLTCGGLIYAAYRRFAAAGDPGTATAAVSQPTPGGAVVGLPVGPSPTVTLRPVQISPSPSSTPVTPTATTEWTPTPPADTPTPAGRPGFSYTLAAQVFPPGAQTRLRGVEARNGIVYLLAESGWLGVYDLTSLTAGQAAAEIRSPVAELQLANGGGLLRYNDLIYVYGKKGLEVLDVSNPSAPEKVDSVEGPSANNLVRSENNLIAPGDGRIVVYDVSLSGFPSLSTAYATGEGLEVYGAAVLQNRLYVSEYRPGQKKSARLSVLDFTDPTNMRELYSATWYPPAFHLLVDDQQLIACTPDDVQLWDLGQPDRPENTGVVPADGRACVLDSGIVLSGNSAIWPSSSGLQVFSTYPEDTPQAEAVPLGAVMMDEYALIARPDRLLVLVAVTN